MINSYKICFSFICNKLFNYYTANLPQLVTFEMSGLQCELICSQLTCYYYKVNLQFDLAVKITSQ